MINDIKNKYDIDKVVVHHHSPFLRFYTLFLKKKEIVIYQHHVQEKSKNLKSKIEYLLDKLVLFRAGTIIAISERVKRSLIDVYSINSSRITIIYNGVDIAAFYNSDHRSTDTVHLCYVGRVIHGKGIQVTLEALSKLNSEVMWDYSVVGDGEYMPDLKELTRNMHLENKVKFLGNRNDVPRLLKNYDVFIHSCIEEEGFGIGVVEAMAASKIVIASKCGGLTEIIDNNVDGYLVKQGDSDDLAECLFNVINKINCLDDVRSRALKKAQKFAIEKYANNLDYVIGCGNENC